MTLTSELPNSYHPQLLSPSNKHSSPYGRRYMPARRLMGTKPKKQKSDLAAHSLL
jgi:hypothetical protein